MVHHEGQDSGSVKSSGEGSAASPFAEGYIAAARESLPAEARDAPFAPETLAAMPKDCERYPGYLRKRVLHLTAEDGRRFWQLRQLGSLGGFPPVTLYLSDDGKVRQRESV